MKIHYVTGNSGKFEEAKRLFSGSDIELIHTDLELEEIQGTPEAIGNHKIAEAYKKLAMPCMIDDVSVHCSALGGLPGPYIRAFLESLGPKGLAELISHYTDPSCQVICTIGYSDNSGNITLFRGVVEGKIVAPRGGRLAHTHSWNAIVEPKNSLKTFAEMPLEEAMQFSARTKALQQCKNHVLSI